MKSRKLTRVVSGLIALVICLSLFSCGKEKEDLTNGGTASLEDLNFKGATFTIQSSANLNEWDVDSFRSSNYLIQGAEEIVGDKASDAALQRNSLVENMLNIKLNYMESDYAYNTVSSDVRNLVLSGGADDIHLIINDIRIIGLCAEGLFHDASGGAYFDFDQNYWYDDLMESVSLKSGTRYILMGDYFIDIIRYSNSILFNKDLYEIFGGDGESIYDIVRDGDWTLDTLMSIMEGGEGYNYTSTYIDLTGNRKRDTRDTYGIAFVDYWGSCIPFLISTDPGYITRDEEGFPVLTNYNNETVSLCEKLDKLYHMTETAFMIHNGDAGVKKAFLENRLLFIGGQMLGHLESSDYANSEINFAILPYPKLDEFQTNYVTTIHDITEVGFIPASVSYSEFDLVSAVIEALTKESANTVIPKYYESTLKVRYARESANAEMIQLIHDNYGNAFPLAWDYSLESFIMGSISQTIKNGAGTYASYYRSYENSAQSTLSDLITDFKATTEGR
ncbi:MAG: hypothetical protein IKV39_05705 [Clostridia bacterium]|nr:hypothetical protein [Clostridia bacterium]